MTPSAPAIPDNSNGDAYEKCFPDCDHPVAEGSLCSVCLGKRRIGSLPNSTPAVEILAGSTRQGLLTDTVYTVAEVSMRGVRFEGSNLWWNAFDLFKRGRTCVYKLLSNPASPPVEPEPQKRDPAFMSHTPELLMRFHAHLYPEKRPSHVAAQGEQNGKRIGHVNPEPEAVNHRNNGRPDDVPLPVGGSNRGASEEPAEVAGAQHRNHEAGRSLHVGRPREHAEHDAERRHEAVGATEAAPPSQPAASAGEPYLPAVGERVRVIFVSPFDPNPQHEVGDEVTVSSARREMAATGEKFIRLRSEQRVTYCKVEPVTPDKGRADDASQQDSSGSQETGSRELARGAGMPPAAATSGGPDETIAELTLQRDEARAVIDRALFELGEHSQAISLPAAIRALRSQLTQAQSDLAESKRGRLDYLQQLHSMVRERDELARKLEDTTEASKRFLAAIGSDEAREAHDSMIRLLLLNAAAPEVAPPEAKPESNATKVEPGTTLDGGKLYRIVAIADYDTKPAHQLLEVVECEGRRPNLRTPPNMIQYNWSELNKAWFCAAPHDSDRSGTWVTGLELVSLAAPEPAPTPEPPPPPLETWRNIHTGQVGVTESSEGAAVTLTLDNPAVRVWSRDEFLAAHERVKS